MFCRVNYTLYSVDSEVKWRYYVAELAKYRQNMLNLIADLKCLFDPKNCDYTFLGV